MNPSARAFVISDMADDEKKLSWSQRFWQEWLRPLILVVAVMAPLRSAVADWNDVPTGSMKPTILEGDRVVVNKLAYDLKVPFTTIHIAQWDDPERGDIVVFWSPADGKRLVKRAIGLPGDKIELRENVLYVNGTAAQYDPLPSEIVEQMAVADQFGSQFLRESVPGSTTHPVMAKPYAPAMRSFGPVVVPAGQYFVMGDNRDESYDSRWIGFIERRRIVGKAVAIAFSLDRGHFYKPRLARFFRSLS
jgi:signal peptidase I